MRPLLVLVLAVAAAAQTGVRPKDVRQTAKAGSSALPKLQEYLKDPSVDVRAEAVKQITEIGPPRSLDPLVLATQDNDPEVQILATDGLVNFYLPGYVKTGLGGSLRRVGTSIKGHFTDTNDQVIDPFIDVRSDVVSALGRLIRGGGNMDARANAARAAGVLRAKAALPELVNATHSKDSTLIYESLVAMQKIRDESAAPQVAFLLRDFDSKVQIAAIQTVGLLKDRQDLPLLIGVLNKTDNSRVKREALEAIAMVPDESSRPIFQQYLHDKDEKLRASAAEGFARLKNPRDLPMMEQAWKDEEKTSPRLSLAFAQVMLGKSELSEFSPLRFLINNLNSSAYNGVAQPFLLEAARDPNVRAALYGPLATGTRDEKIGLARVLGSSGDAKSAEELQKLTNDPDANVAQAAMTAVRNLRTRM
jgi:HEAT repeat protein